MGIVTAEVGIEGRRIVPIELIPIGDRDQPYLHTFAAQRDPFPECSCQ
jgi:hypothetical protein